MAEGKDYCERKINLLKSNYDQLLEQADEACWMGVLHTESRENSTGELELRIDMYCIRCCVSICVGGVSTILIQRPHRWPCQRNGLTREWKALRDGEVGFNCRMSGMVARSIVVVVVVDIIRVVVVTMMVVEADVG
ncbi:hypothetical protein RHMOL_Rhmol09G0090500 [Rhododendron molle]|uniref:Uncharacterized protein n=1 Tax=Rhododendron molle TaxID=49168 RepID=A0ACC0MBD9_RHOML|nr:hypothetical protein RHMOL_Rhmol09G0090500 [Rhododendron molle]